MPVRLAAVACTVTIWSVATLADQTPTLDSILARAGRYVARFVDEFSNVVAEERYVQDTLGNLSVVPPGRGLTAPLPLSRRREIKSDFLLVRVDGFDWLPFRDVFEVDGTPVRDREERLAKLFLRHSATALEQAQEIARESARYNIGAMQRTVNTPLLALVFLDLDTQPRFHFSLGKRDTGAGENIRIVEFNEEVRPTFVKGLRDSDVPASGRFWIDTETGRIIKTELNLESTGIRARLTTLFRRDERFQIDVPYELREHYDLARSQVSGIATYGRFRRFDVAAEESFHNPAVQTITDRRTGLMLVEVPAGRFTMGSSASESSRRVDETPHDVTINRSFFLGQHEVTQQEWRSVVASSPSRFAECGPRCPVENITFSDVQVFLAALNAPDDREFVYRLPTEAEWEYACRAGTVTPFSTGDALTTAQANYDGQRPYGKTSPGMFRGRPTRVGGFPSNAWGLADMHGNVAEWTADWYGAYQAEDVVDPQGAPASDKRVVRGGSWQVDAGNTRCASRVSQDPRARDSTVGFRVAADRLQK